MSAAGPVGNLVLAAIFSVVLRLGRENPGFMQLAFFGVGINIFLALFRPGPHPAPGRLPHPGPELLPRELARLYDHLQPVGFILILILFYTGIMGAILMPLYQQIALIMLG